MCTCIKITFKRSSQCVIPRARNEIFKGNVDKCWQVTPESEQFFRKMRFAEIVSNCTHKTPGRCWRSCTRRLWGPRASGCPPLGGWESVLTSHPKYVTFVQHDAQAWLSPPPRSQSRCSRPWRTLSSDCSWRRGSRTATRQTSSSLPHEHSATCLHMLRNRFDENLECTVLVLLHYMYLSQHKLQHRHLRAQ